MRDDFRFTLGEIVGHSRRDCLRVLAYRSVDPMVEEHAKNHVTFCPPIPEMLEEFDQWLIEHDQELISGVVARLQQAVDGSWDGIPSWEIDDLIEDLRNGEL